MKLCPRSSSKEAGGTRPYGCRLMRKYSAALGGDRGYSAHLMRASFITTALENGAQLEDAQKAAGHRDPGTTKLYDRRGYNPEKAASCLATYWPYAALDSFAHIGGHRRWLIRSKRRY